MEEGRKAWDGQLLFFQGLELRMSELVDDAFEDGEGGRKRKREEDGEREKRKDILTTE